MRKKKNKGGRPKGEPTKVVRVPVKRPDFEKIASDNDTVSTHDSYLGFMQGCNYVWDTHIEKILTIHKIP